MNINEVWLGGRLTKDPEVRKTQTGKSVCSFTVAVDRPMAKDAQAETEKQADFIQCVAWGGVADRLAADGEKGSQVYAIGRIQTRNYTNQSGQKVYVTEVQCRDAHAEKRSSSKRADYGSNMGTSSYSFEAASASTDPIIDPDTGEVLPF